MKKRVGERVRVKGKFVRFGEKRGFKGPLQTILLSDVRDYETDELLTDHIWFTRGSSWPTLKSGDQVALNARIDSYQKGYNGRRPDVYVREEIDYRLTRPTKIEIVE
ncbi:hypothetical protein [Tritonibacter mobilis]|uniref:hypothetical protein n=1 Tax=Tritonibacter mobilis TaxID=379347 RepID=UPI0039A458E5